MIPKFIQKLFIDKKTETEISYNCSFDLSIKMLKHVGLFNYVDVIINSPQQIIRGRTYIAHGYQIDSVIIDVIKRSDFVAVLVNEHTMVGSNNQIRVIILNRNDVGEYVQYVKPTVKQYGKYIVDISKPPIGPPLVRFEETFLHTGESRESVRDTRDWADYCMAYANEIEKSKHG